MHHSIPPQSQPLQTYFKGSKRITAVVPKSDGECNPFLADGSSSSSITVKNQSNLEGPILSTQHNLKASRGIVLGEQHLTLLSLHSAVEHALVVHMATSGGDAVDCSQSATPLIQLPSVVTYTTLRPIVERSCGRRFGPTELARLIWLWGAGNSEEDRPGCNIGFHVTKGKTMDRVGNKSYDYFFSLQVGVELPMDEEDEEEQEFKEERRKRRISSDGKIIPTTPPRKRVRPLDLPDEPQTPSPSPRSISVFAKHSTLLTPPASPSLHKTPVRSPSTAARSRSVSANGSILTSPAALDRNSLSLVAIWNTGINRRKKEVRRRLVNWTLGCYETWRRERTVVNAGEVVQSNPMDVDRPCTPPPTLRRAVQGQGGILTPSATREEGWVPGRKRTKDFFAHDVEERILIREWDAAFPLDKVALTPQAALPEVASSSSRTASSRPIATLRNKAVKKPLHGGPTPTTMANLSLTERIKAKQDAKQSEMDARSGHGLGLLDVMTEDSIGIEQSRSSMMANLKRRSALSRLQDIAESLYMIFTSSSTNSSNKDETGGVVKKYPHLAINEVAKSICNSSKVAMSEMEARHSMKMLQEIAPGFVEINRVGPREWVRLGTTLIGQQVPATNGGLLGLVRQRIRAEMDRS